MKTFDFSCKMAVAAHRGDSHDCFENTMEAFRAAVEAGVDMVETDIRLTADRQLVLFHDDRLGRTANVSGPVNGLTLAQLQQLNIGTPAQPARIPTLEEFLLWAQPLDILLNLELKEYDVPGNEGNWQYCADETVRLVEKYGLADRVVLNSFDAAVLDYIDTQYNHRYRLHGFYPYAGMRNVRRDPGEYLYCACIWGGNKQKRIYDELIALGIEPWVGASFTSQAELEMACSYGARLVTTNTPADTLKKLRNLGAHQ